MGNPFSTPAVMVEEVHDARNRIPTTTEATTTTTEETTTTTTIDEVTVAPEITTSTKDTPEVTSIKPEEVSPKTEEATTVHESTFSIEEVPHTSTEHSEHTSSHFDITTTIEEVHVLTEPTIHSPEPTITNPFGEIDIEAFRDKIRKRAAETEGKTYGAIDFKTINDTILVATAIGIFMSLASAMIFYKFRNERVFRASGRTFMYILLGGSFFTLASMGLVPTLELIPTPTMCFSIFSLETTGFVIVFGCLTVKIMRVLQFLKEKSGYPRYNDFQLLKVLLGYITFWLICLIFLSFVPMATPVYLSMYSQNTAEIHDGMPVKQYFYQCHMGSMETFKLWFEGISIVGAFCCIFYTRRIVAPFYESMWT